MKKSMLNLRFRNHLNYFIIIKMPKKPTKKNIKEDEIIEQIDIKPVEMAYDNPFTQDVKPVVHFKVIIKDVKLEESRNLADRVIDFIHQFNASDLDFRFSIDISPY
jgi:hypothetical protein